MSTCKSVTRRPILLLLLLAAAGLLGTHAFVSVFKAPPARARTYAPTMMAPPPSSASKLTKLPDLSAPLLNFYAETRKQATEAVQAALKAGVRQMEIEVPIQPGRIDVSLGETLDDSREWVREFIRPFTTKGQKLWVVFPDAKEATLAGNRWGGTNFRIMGIKTAMKIPKEEPCELMVIVTPGFNIDEFLDLPKVDRGAPTIVVNGNLDRVRGGYYPRIFYPGLYNCKEKYLRFFEPIFYLKPVQGGLLFRRFPEPWQEVLTYYDPATANKKGAKKILTQTVGTSDDRPAYNDVVAALKRAAAGMAE